MNDLNRLAAEGRPRTITVDNNRSLHLTVHGKGLDVVLIHGALTTGRDWLGAPLEALEGLGRLIVIDRPGHGLSRRPRFEAGPHAQAAQIRAGMEAIGSERPLLVAHSLGAAVALAFANAFPDRVAGLVLVGPMIFPESRPLERALYGPRSLPGVGPAMSALMNRGPDKAILEQMHRLMFFPQPRPASWEANYPWDWMLSPEAGVINGEEFATTHPWTLDSPRVSGVDCPVSILIGEEDLIVRPAGQGVALAGMIPQARLRRIEGAGHMIHHTHAAVLRDVVDECLERATSAA